MHKKTPKDNNFKYIAEENMYNSAISLVVIIALLIFKESDTLKGVLFPIIIAAVGIVNIIRQQKYLNKELGSETSESENDDKITVVSYSPKKKSGEIVTTDEEMHSFYIVKGILAQSINPSSVTYKDTLSYFSVLIDNKPSKWICRVYLKESINYVIIPENDENKKYIINSIDEIYDLSEHLIKRATDLTK